VLLCIFVNEIAALLILTLVLTALFNFYVECFLIEMHTEYSMCALR